MTPVEWHDLILGVTLFSLGAILYIGFPHRLDQLTRKMAVFDFERRWMEQHAENICHAIGICFCVLSATFWLLTLGAWRGVL